MTIRHRTTREHYEKYRALAEAARVTLLTDNKKFLGILKEPCQQSLNDARDKRRANAIMGCMGCWLCMYRLDKALNSVPLRKWDMMVESYWMYNGRRVVKTLCDGGCMYKHLVIYQIIGAEPEFTEGSSP